MPLIKTITGQGKKRISTPMKQGSSLEPHAFRKYKSIMTKGRQHSKFNVVKTGLVILKSHTFTAVSQTEISFILYLNETSKIERSFHFVWPL